MSDEMPLDLIHRVQWTVEPEDVRGELVCTAPPGSPCRVVCAAQPPCEEACTGDPETGEEHPQVDAGYCNIREWMSEECSVAYYYAGERTELRAGPVITRWHPLEDHFVWVYPDHAHAFKATRNVSDRWLYCDCGERQKIETAVSA